MSRVDGVGAEDGVVADAERAQMAATVAANLGDLCLGGWSGASSFGMVS